jgi:hypothetical protein
LFFAGTTWNWGDWDRPTETHVNYSLENRKGALNMPTSKTLLATVMTACSFLVLASLATIAEDKKDETTSLSGTWAKKDGQMKIEFSEKDVLKLLPHGDSAVVVKCEYKLTKEKLVKAKITGHEGKDDIKKVLADLVPIGTEFTFKWQAKDDSAKVEEVKCDKADTLKSHLEGDYEEKK